MLITPWHDDDDDNNNNNNNNTVAGGLVRWNMGKRDLSDSSDEVAEKLVTGTCV